MVDHTASLLEKLILLAKEISEISISKFKCVLKKQCCDLCRRIRFLMPLFEEFGEIKNAIPEDTVVAMDLMREALELAKQLLEFGCHGSQLYMILEREQIKQKFNDLSVRFEQAISKSSYENLYISEEVKEQVELVKAQFGRSKERFDPIGEELVEYLLSTHNPSYYLNTDPDILRVICEKLQFFNVQDIKQEAIALDKTVVAKAVGSDLLKNTQEMTRLLKKIEDLLLTESANIVGSANKDSSPHADDPCSKLGSQSLVIPDEFRCPISLELMKDPVIICTGQTYERACIKKWLEAGHGTCPKTRQILFSTILTPNHALYSLISNWCEANEVEPPKRLGNLRLCMATSDGSTEFVELDTLMAKLTSIEIEDQRSAAGELRLLAKQNGQNRMLIAEAGAVPLLVDLLHAPDSRTQDHAVTALLNLSILEDNKECIMASDAVPGILHVLKNGSMEARENAAATFFSLSVVDEYRVTIGASGAIPALVTLLREGSQRGQVDAAAALFKLCLYEGNKGRAARAGAVPALMEMITQPGGEMIDEALAIMAALASHPDGQGAIGSLIALPILVELIGHGSYRNRENATAVLVHLCSRYPGHLSLIKSLEVIDSLLDMAENGTERGRRKATQLLELIGDFAEHCEYFRQTIN